MKIPKKNPYKCLYCDKETRDPHFQSACCGRGMCDDCFDNLQGTDEQIQVDYMEDEDYDRIVKGTKYENNADYLCFNCVE